ncbi:glycoside hydrolase family 2 protein [Pedobacter sp. NJ-S-72]
MFTFSSFSSFGQSRENISFNQDWTFRKTNDTLTQKSEWEKVTLPHSWNATDMQLTKDFYEGEGQYKKQIVFGQEYKNKRLFLRFEGVGQVAQVYVNQKLVGTHKGSYSAFALDITYAVKLGESNTILVKVNNKARKDIIPVNHFLFGIYGGIYRPVSLLVTSKVNITTTDYASPGIYISQKNVSAESAVAVAVKIENTETSWQDIMIKTEIYDQAGKIVSSQNTPQKITTQGRQKFVQNFRLQPPHLWNGLKDPYIYKVKTQLLRNGEVIDEVEQPLGLRKFELIAGKGFFLNGQSYPMYGVCRHQDRWQFGNALSNAQHKEDLDIIKEMGATTIRFAHYQQAEYLYSTCDTMGFVVIWAEIPFVNTSTGEEADNAKQQLMELIKQNYNHPSLYVWGLHNEVYGKTPADYPAVLTRELNDIAKSEDPDRYTVSVSGYGEMDRPTNLNADIQGMNRYYGWYEGKVGDLEDWAKGLETNYPANKVILTEYGADGNVFHQQEQSELKETYDYTSAFYPESFETKTHE